MHNVVYALPIVFCNGPKMRKKKVRLIKTAKKVIRNVVFVKKNVN